MKEKYNGEKEMENALKVWSMLASLLIVFINTCLLLQIKKFAEYIKFFFTKTISLLSTEKNLTTTEFYISVARKLTYVLLFE